MTTDHDKVYDLCIIGGGINGCGIARDAAGRGLSVLLCEQDDLANGTSSRSSKLIHGGLRYLEQYQFRLVREALKEREVLMQIAPHLIRELRFVLPHERHLRPRYLLRIGLWLYDHLARRRTLKKSHAINFANNIYGAGLKTAFKNGFIYSDCWADDAKLVIANASSARRLGADIRTRHRCIAIQADKSHWQVTLQQTNNPHVPSQQKIAAKVIVNAAGPWVATIIDNILQQRSHYQSKLVKGSHIIVPKLYEGEHAYILQNTDQRIVFAIPYENSTTLVGTTDESYDGDPAAVTISQHEITYLCQLINRYFRRQIEPSDIIWHYSGLRPLYDDDQDNLSNVSRDYTIDYHDHPLPWVNIFGGKLTSYRQLSEKLLDGLKKHFHSLSAAWTDKQALDGGNINGSITAYFATLQRQYPWLAPSQLKRYLHCYGSNVPILLKNCQQLSDLGQHFVADLYEKEVRYLAQYEWAQSAEDILWRRTKLGLQCSEDAQQKLQRFFTEHLAKSIQH